MLVKTKLQNFFQFIYSPPPPLRKSRLVEVLMWWVSMEWPYRPTWYCSQGKLDICAICRLCVISSMSNYIIVGNVSPFRNTPKCWVWIILIQFHTGTSLLYSPQANIWICTNKKRLLYTQDIVLWRHKLISLKLWTKFHHCFQNKSGGGGGTQLLFE